MNAESEKPSTLMMLLKIGGTTLIMAGVVFLIASGDLLPGLPLCACGIGLLVVANQLTPKAPAQDGTSS